MALCYSVRVASFTHDQIGFMWNRIAPIENADDILIPKAGKLSINPEYHGLIRPTRLPGLLVTQTDHGCCMFLHHNYTLYDCNWGNDDIRMCDKITVFRAVAAWLRALNTTELNATFRYNTDDHLAWQVAQGVFDE